MSKSSYPVGYGRPPEHTRLRSAAAEERDEAAEESEGEDDEEIGEEDRFVFDDEHARQMFGDRYDEFKERFERAVNAVDIDALCDLALDFGDAKFPGAGKKAGNFEKKGVPDAAPPKTRRHQG